MQLLLSLVTASVYAELHVKTHGSIVNIHLNYFVFRAQTAVRKWEKKNEYC